MERSDAALLAGACAALVISVVFSEAAAQVFIEEPIPPVTEKVVIEDPPCKRPGDAAYETCPEVRVTRYTTNVDGGLFGIGADPANDLLYVSQRGGGSIAVFDRGREEFTRILRIPTAVSGPHDVEFDEVTNSVWTGAGESSKIARWIRDTENWVEYTQPGGTFQADRQPHTIAFLRPGGPDSDDPGDLWFTDGRGERVGILDIRSGRVRFVRDPASGEIDAIQAEGFSFDGRTPPRAWVVGGTEITLVDTATEQVICRHPVLEQDLPELGLHESRFDGFRTPRSVWTILRGPAAGVLRFDADVEDGDVCARTIETLALVNSIGNGGSGQHIDVGRRFVWWTEDTPGAPGTVVRHDPTTGETTGYAIALPLLFNPHGLRVISEWKEVWVTELYGLLRIQFDDVNEEP